MRAEPVAIVDGQARVEWAQRCLQSSQPAGHVVYASNWHEHSRNNKRLFLLFTERPFRCADLPTRIPSPSQISHFLGAHWGASTRPSLSGHTHAAASHFRVELTAVRGGVNVYAALWQAAVPVELNCSSDACGPSLQQQPIYRLALHLHDSLPDATDLTSTTLVVQRSLTSRGSADKCNPLGCFEGTHPFKLKDSQTYGRRIPIAKCNPHDETALRGGTCWWEDKPLFKIAAAQWLLPSQPPKRLSSEARGRGRLQPASLFEDCPGWWEVTTNGLPLRFYGSCGTFPSARPKLQANFVAVGDSVMGAVSQALSELITGQHAYVKSMAESWINTGHRLCWHKSYQVIQQHFAQLVQQKINEVRTRSRGVPTFLLVAPGVHDAFAGVPYYAQQLDSFFQHLSPLVSPGVHLVILSSTASNLALLDPTFDDGRLPNGWRAQQSNQARIARQELFKAFAARAGMPFIDVMHFSSTAPPALFCDAVHLCRERGMAASIAQLVAEALKTEMTGPKRLPIRLPHVEGWSPCNESKWATTHRG